MSIVVVSEEDRECNRILELEKGNHFAVLELDPKACEYEDVKERTDALMKVLRDNRKPKVREARKRVRDASSALGDKQLFALAKQRFYQELNVGVEAKIKWNMDRQDIVNDTTRLEKRLAEAASRRMGMRREAEAKIEAGETECEAPK